MVDRIDPVAADQLADAVLVGHIGVFDWSGGQYILRRFRYMGHGQNIVAAVAHPQSRSQLGTDLSRRTGNHDSSFHPGSLTRCGDLEWYYNTMSDSMDSTIRLAEQGLIAYPDDWSGI